MHGADDLVLESTYGDRLHKNGDVLNEMAERITSTLSEVGLPSTATKMRLSSLKFFPQKAEFPL